VDSRLHAQASTLEEIIWSRHNVAAGFIPARVVRHSGGDKPRLYTLGVLTRIIACRVPSGIPEQKSLS
jgi:hypothetical protein